MVNSQNDQSTIINYTDYEVEGRVEKLRTELSMLV